MARVTYGSGVTELAGSIGGITYQRNPSGTIAKLRNNPIVNPSSRQAPYNQRLAYLVSLWAQITQAKKDVWDTFAAAHDHTTPWGEVKTLSGYQWFMSCNLKRLLQEVTAIEDAPVWAVQAPPDQFTIEIRNTYIRAAWAPNYNAPLDLIAYCSLPLKQSSIKLRRSLFWIKNYEDAPDMANWDLTSEIEDLINVTWADFYAASDCNLIIRLQQGDFAKGLFSSYVSAIIKVT